MAAPNTLEVRLSFKPLMEGLDRFTAGINARLQQVQVFNERIRSGDSALQKLVGQVGVVLGAAALARYSREAREADTVQQQLIRTLERTGQTGALDALNAQAAALQRLTHFSDEAVSAVQRLLISFGLTAQQAQEMSGLVLDFAQETGQSAESAAMLIGRTLGGESDELGRYRIQLDQTKGKVEALTEALTKFAAGAARGAVADPLARQTEARYADATRNLGRAANRLATPFLAALVPLLERAADAATRFAAALTPVAPMLGDMAAAAVPLIAGVALISGGFTAIKMVINPLRALIVLLAGQSLSQLSAALATSTGGLTGMWATMTLGKGVIAGLGAALATVGSVIAAAFAGWSLGSMANEIELNGLKVKDWAALWVYAVKDTIGGAWSWLKGAWINTKFTLQEGMIALLLFIREKQLAVIESLNGFLAGYNTMADKLGINRASLFDTKRERAEIDALGAKLGDLEKARVAALAALQSERATQSADAASDMAFIADGDDAFRHRRKQAPAAAKGRPDLNDERFGKADTNAASAAAEFAQKRAIFELELAISEAQKDRNFELENRLTRERDELTLTRELLALVPDAASYYEILAGIKARLDLEEGLRRTQQQRAADERAHAEQEFTLTRALADLDQEIATIESGRYTTTEQKLAKTLPLLRAQNAALAERIRLLDEELARLPLDDPRRLDLRRERADLSDKKVGVQTKSSAAQPQTIGQSVVATSIGLQDQIGTVAEQVGRVWGNTAESMRTSMGGAFADMILKAQSFKAASLGFIQSVGTAFIQSGAQMVADWIMSHTVMTAAKSAATAADVGIHTAGEVAKTTATAVGAGAREGFNLGETIFAGVQWIIRTATHLAGEVANTAITLAQTPIRLPLILAETDAYIFKAAAGAMSAMASIPYVGPFLAIAAMGAIIAAGAKLVGGFATGGLVEGPGYVSGPGTSTSDSIPARLSDGEFVARAASVRRFGAPFFARLNAGVLDLTTLPARAAPLAFSMGGLVSGIGNLAELPASVARGIATPPAAVNARGADTPAGGGAAAVAPDVKIFNAFFSDRPSAEQWLRSKDGRRNLIRMRGDLGQET